MNRTQVRKLGTKIGESDFYSDGVFAGTSEYYDVMGEIYHIYSPTNTFTYMGEPRTVLFDTKKNWERYETLSICIDTGLEEDEVKKYLGREE